MSSGFFVTKSRTRSSHAIRYLYSCSECHVKERTKTLGMAAVSLVFSVVLTAMTYEALTTGQVDFFDTQTLTLRDEHPIWFYGYLGFYVICAALFLAALIAYLQKWRQQ
jgi:hypothetical protein